MDIYDHILHKVIKDCNEMVRLAVLELATNISPENDKVLYTYNTIVRHRIIDIRTLKNSLISGIKAQFAKGKASGLDNDKLEELGSRIEKIVKDNKDILENREINTAGHK